jgi:hypothetical protein
MFEKDVVDVGMPRLEVVNEAGQKGLDLGVGNGQQPLDDVLDPVLLARPKEPSDDPAWIRQELDRQSSYVHGHRQTPAGEKMREWLDLDA